VIRMWRPLSGTRQEGECREEADGRYKEEDERDARRIGERGDPMTY
jgi:hypothetical protein